MLGSELLIVSIFPAINIGHIPNQVPIIYILILAISSKTLFFLIIRIILSLTNSKNSSTKINTKESLFLLFVPLSTLFILSTLATTTITYKLTFNIHLLITLSCVLILSLNFIVYGIFYYISKKNKQYTKIALQLQHDKDITNYYKDLLKSDEEQKILIHDIKKHLESLAILNTSGNHVAVTEYIQKISKMDILQSSIRICNHELLNVLLYRYLTKARENDINLYIDIRNNSMSFMKNDDITGLFCNLLNNAFEATSNTPNSYIELSITQSEDTLSSTISLINSCISNPFLRDGKTLLSKKPNPHRHGLGIKSIDKIIIQYNGIINRYYQDETKTFHTIILFNNINATK